MMSSISSGGDGQLVERAGRRPTRAGAARCRRRTRSSRPRRPTARRASPAAPSPTGRAPGRRTARGCRPASRRSRRGTARPRWCGRRGRRRWPRPARRGTPPGSSAARSSRPWSSRSVASGSGCWSRSRIVAGELADGPAQLERAAGTVAVPERHLAGHARRRRDDDPLEGDLLDAPRRRPEQERLAGPRLVDHLLVELADPGAVGQEHAEQPAVGDGAGVGDRQPLGPGPAAHHAATRRARSGPTRCGAGAR